MGKDSVDLDELIEEAAATEDVTLNLAVFPDEPPSSGDWVDIDEVLSAPTEEEMEEGRILGEGIDPDDDEDGTESEE